MNSRELAVTLLSFIWVLGLTHILQCLRDLWIARERVKWSASQLMWMVTVLALTILSWLPLADIKLEGWVFATMLAYAVVIYFTAAFVSPRVPDEGELDLAAYESREGLAYKLLLVLTVVLAMVINRSMHAETAVAPFLVGEWPRLLVASLALLSLWPNRWVRTA